MIDKDILPEAAETIFQTLKHPEWDDLTDEEIWERLIDDTGNGEGWDEDVLFALYSSSDDLREKIISFQNSKNLNQGVNMENQKGILEATDEGVIVKFAKPEGEGKALDPKSVKQTGKTNKPSDCSTEINRIKSQLDKKFSHYEAKLLESAAFRANLYDTMKLAEMAYAPEIKTDVKPDRGKPGVDKLEKPDMGKPEKLEGGISEPSSEKGKGPDKKLDDISIDKVKSLIQELSKVISRIKGAVGIADDAKEKLEIGEPLGDDIGSLPPSKDEKEKGGKDLKGLVDKGTDLKMKVEDEVSKLSWILDKATGNLETIVPPIAVDKMDQGVADGDTAKCGDSAPSTPEPGNTMSTPDSNTEGEGTPSTEPENSPSTCDSEDFVLTEDEQSAIVAYLQSIDFINSFFEDVLSTDKVGEKIASVLPTLIIDSGKERIAIMKKVALKEKVTQKEADLLDEFNVALADRVEKIAEVAETFMYTPPNTGDYGNRDVQKQVAKENIRGNSKPNIQNTSDKIDRKFLSVKASVEKIMTNKFAKFDKALDAAGEAIYKEIISNPLKTALYKYCQEAGLDADTANFIIESSFDSSAEASHEMLIKRAKELASLDDVEFIKKANQISRADKQVSAQLVEDDSSNQDVTPLQEPKTAEIANKVVVSSPGTETANESEQVVKDYWSGHITRKVI